MTFVSTTGIAKLILATALLGSVCLAAQDSHPGVAGPTAMRSVGGLVTGPNSEPVEGAVVLLTDTKTLQVRSFLTLKDGSYHFYGLSQDVSYEVRAEHGKQTSGTKTVSSFNEHKSITVNLKLKS